MRNDCDHCGRPSTLTRHGNNFCSEACSEADKALETPEFDAEKNRDAIVAIVVSRFGYVPILPQARDQALEAAEAALRAAWPHLVSVWTEESRPKPGPPSTFVKDVPLAKGQRWKHDTQDRVYLIEAVKTQWADVIVYNEKRRTRAAIYEHNLRRKYHLLAE